MLNFVVKSPSLQIKLENLDKIGMTIIKPSASKKYLGLFLLIFGVLFVAGMFYIYQYNQLVTAKHRMADLELAYADQQSINADLKTKIYQLTDPEILRQAAVENGLILENRPAYLQVEKWSSALLY
ncbi:MAG: hypothetical protein Q8L36_03710 [bacterium]|nr:hypothetical protein [bacterium]